MICPGCCETAECLSHLLGHHLSWDSTECPFTSVSYQEPRPGISTPVCGAVDISGFPRGCLSVTAKMEARSLPVRFLKGTTSLHEDHCRQGAASEIWLYDVRLSVNLSFLTESGKGSREETTNPRVLWSLLAGRSDPAPSASCSLFQPHLGVAVQCNACFEFWRLSANCNPTAAGPAPAPISAPCPASAPAPRSPCRL